MPQSSVAAVQFLLSCSKVNLNYLLYFISSFFIHFFYCLCVFESPTVILFYQKVAEHDASNLCYGARKHEIFTPRCFLAKQLSFTESCTNILLLMTGSHAHFLRHSSST